MKPQGEVTNAEFHEVIRMLKEMVTNQVMQKQESGHKEAYISRIHEFLRMNPPSFKGSSITEDLDNFIDEFKMVLDLMHVADAEKVELVAYYLKNVGRTLFDQWKEGRYQDAPHPGWAYFKEALLGVSFPKN